MGWDIKFVISRSTVRFCAPAPFYLSQKSLNFSAVRRGCEPQRNLGIRDAIQSGCRVLLSRCCCRMLLVAVTTGGPWSDLEVAINAG